MTNCISRPRSALATAILFLFPTLSAAALVEITFDSQGRFGHSTSIAPGNFIEVCGKLSQGTRTAWSFEAQAPVDFNIHYHVGDKVEFPERRPAVSRLSGTLHAPVDQDYCWMWKSSAESPVPITLELRRGARR